MDKLSIKDKIVRDNIHGYIEIPKIIFEKIIDTPVFQRLRRIEQTSMRCLYPSASHDRFSHSLGVYYLGKKATAGLRGNLGLYRNEDDEEFWQVYELLFSLACLLHDCAHSPFSHSFESAYVNIEEVDDVVKMETRLIKSMLEIPGEIPSAALIERTKTSIHEYFYDSKNNPQKISPHELASSIVASEFFAQGILDIVDHFGFQEKKHDEDNIEYIQFIQRSILGLKYDLTKMKPDLTDVAYRRENFKNCLISLLNSNSFDVDKLDYITRDSVQSGVNNVTVDNERLLNSLTIIEVHIYDRLTKIEGDINNSIRIEKFEGKIMDNSDDVNELSLELKEVSFEGDFKASIELKDGSLFNIGTSKNLTHGELGYKEENGKGKIAGSLKGSYGGRLSVPLREGEYSLNGSACCKIEGEFQGSIIGRINGIKDKGRTIYEIGYKQNSISILEDTWIARNRLYIWIYGHHKVVYSDYALRYGILFSTLRDNLSNPEDNIENVKRSKNNLSDLICIDALIDKSKETYLIDDGDLTSKMKPTNNEYSIEWLSRKYKHSVWKSFAEFNTIFAHLPEKQLKELWAYLFYGLKYEIKTGNEVFPSEGNSDQYKDSFLTSLRTKKKVSKFVWIKPSGIKTSSINTENTYVVLNDRVARLKDVLVRSKTTEEYADQNFFYLYTSEELDKDEKKELIETIKKAIMNK